MIPEGSTLRIARPTDNLATVSKMYIQGLGFRELGSFKNHKGFNGVLLGHDLHPYHIEFTHHIGTTVGKAPTKDNLLVFYIADRASWSMACSAMEKAGFRKVDSYNPYWDDCGYTYEDIDAYRVVLQND